MDIKNIVFDLGGVILDVDYQRTIEAFKALGCENFDAHYTQAQQSGVFDDFEVGKIAPETFIESLRNLMPKDPREEQVAAAWNAMLLAWNLEKIDFIRSLKSRYNLYLFSNTNIIHKTHFEKTLREQIGIQPLDDLFIKAYYSHEFGKRKPEPESFQALLNENQLRAEETLFIDDTIQHVEGARKIGIQAIHLVSKSILELGL